MVHPLTLRAVTTAATTLAAPLDIGFVFPPRNGEERGRGFWHGRGMQLSEIEALAPRAAGANLRGAAIYMRVAPTSPDEHPGLIMLDDLNERAVSQLDDERLRPRLVVQTSPGNFQAWIALLPAGLTIDHATTLTAVRYLATKFGADPRAVSPRQPGRLPGFTNRKSRHRQPNGQFPFVTITSACPSACAQAGPEIIRRAADEVAQARRGTPEKKSFADLGIQTAEPAEHDLEVLLREAEAQIAHEVSTGRRAQERSSRSEIDFAVALKAVRLGYEETDIVAWLQAARPEKAESYAARTVDAALRIATQTVRIP